MGAGVVMGGGAGEGKYLGLGSGGEYLGTLGS